MCSAPRRLRASPEPPKLNDTTFLTVGSAFAVGDIVVEPTQGDYMRAKTLDDSEFQLLVVTAVDAQGQVSETKPYDSDGQ